jgi:hypothetical protein
MSLNMARWPSGVRGYRGEFAVGGSGTTEQTADRAVTFRRLDGGPFDLQPGVVGRDLLCPGVVRCETLEESGGGHSADRKARGMRKEIAPVNLTVHVSIEELEKFGRKIGSLTSFHLKVSGRVDSADNDPEKAP